MASGVPNSATNSETAADSRTVFTGARLPLRQQVGRHALQASGAGRLHQHNVAGFQLVRDGVERGRAVGDGERFAGPGPDPPGAGQQRRGFLADRDQGGQRGSRHCAANSPMSSWLAREVSPSSAMWPRTAKARPSRRQVAQGVQRGPDRLGVRVVGVVDDRHAVWPRGGPPSATGCAPPRRTARPRCPASSRPSSRGQGGGGQRVRHVVGAVQPEGDRRPSLRVSRSVKPGRPRSSSRTSAARNGAAESGRGPATAGDEGDDPGRGAGGHGQDAGVVGVQDGHAVGGSASTSSPLARATWSRPPNSPACAWPDVQHHAVAGRRDAAQVGDVAGPAGGQLEDQVPGRGVGAQHGQRDGRTRC